MQPGLPRVPSSELFARQLDPGDVAAIFVEPVQGEGGYVFPPPGWLRDLRELCDRHGILLVADEVQSGVGRTGKMWACEHEGVEPDILLTAKGLGSGMPIGAIIAKESISTWESGSHGSTFGGNPVCCAAALATLDLVESELMANAVKMGDRLMAGLRKLEAKHACIGEVRGPGLMMGVEFVKDRRTREPAPELLDPGAERLSAGTAAAGSRQEHAAARAAAGGGRAGRGHRARDHRRPAGRAGLSAASKVATMRDAVAALVRDGDTVVIEGFTHLICFAAGHEIIRQRRRDLTLCRLTPDLIYDQMIAAGCARKLVFSWAGNPGAGSLHAFRRAVEKRDPPLELEEYSHFGMVARLAPARRGSPSGPCATTWAPTSPPPIPRIRSVTCPYTGEVLATVPALNPDVTIVHAQRADAQGNTQIWGLLGVQKEAAFASRRVIVVVEELVDQSVIRADPNRTIIPGLAVDAVVVEPWGAHPSYAQGYYDRDNEFYVGWEPISRDSAALKRYLDEFVHGVRDRSEYVERCGGLERLRAASGCVPG